MSPESAIYLYGAACGVVGTLVSLAVAWLLWRWFQRGDAPEFQGENVDA